MSAGELRWWFRELSTEASYGWAGHHTALARALGFHDCRPGSSLKSKYRERNQAWIYPGEQLRFSTSLRKILAGQVVCKKVGVHWEAVVADDPQPLKQPVRFRYNLTRGGLEWVRVGGSPGAMLPTFANLMSTAGSGTFRGVG